MAPLGLWNVGDYFNRLELGCQTANSKVICGFLWQVSGVHIRG